MHEHHEHEWRVEIWNALSHGAGFLAGLVASVALVTLVAVRGTGWQLAGALVFGISLVMLYAASTLYHSIPHLVTKRRMKVFDHCAIQPIARSISVARRLYLPVWKSLKATPATASVHTTANIHQPPRSRSETSRNGV